METPNNSFLAEKGIFLPGGAQNFSAEDQGDKIFGIEIDNIGTSADDQVIALAPGSGYTAAELTTLLGITVNAVIADGEIISTADKKVNAAGTPGKILSFLRSIRCAPQRFVGMTIEVTNAAQLGQPFKVFKDDPYIGNPVVINQIFPSKQKSNLQNNDKLVHIPLNHFQLDNETIVVFTLKANTTISISMVPGAKHSTSDLLRNEAVKEWTAKNLKRQYGA
jgi:hypothetical protein